MKRLLYLAHRWLGIALCLFMLLWFFSGLIMIYADSAAVQPEQRRARSQPLTLAADGPALRSLWPGHEISAARLLQQAGEAVWLLQDRHGQRQRVSAADGSVRPASPAWALAIAADWQPGTTPQLQGMVVRDAATAMMSYDALRPFYRVALQDDAATELYISAQSGEVVRASTRMQRLLFWGGSYLHFLRPLDALGLSGVRKDILTWSALAGVLAVISGIWIGLSRWRPGWFGRPRYGDGRSNPYRAAWPKWHLWLGLCGGLLALSWMFSGFLANNPWQLFSGKHDAHARQQTAQLPQAAQALDSAQLRAAIHGRAMVELKWSTLGRQAMLFGYQADGSRQLLLGRVPGADDIRQAVLRQYPGAAIRDWQWQTEYDHYYYPQRHRSPSERPLPVWRATLDDSEQTRLYLDPVSGEQTGRFELRRRVYRWLFSALHNWDLAWLLPRPLWDVWMVGGSLCGLALAVSSLVIAWRRLQRQSQRRPRKH